MTIPCNRINATLAWVFCHGHLGLDCDAVLSSLQSFRGLKHRCQWVGVWQGRTFINDSKATNAQSTQQALQGYKNIRWLAGGLAKQGGIQALGFDNPQKFATSNVKKAYFYGHSRDIFNQQFNGAKCVFATIDQALSAVVADYDYGDTILLSPAAASFDQFDHFEARGQAFIDWINDNLDLD